MLSIVLAAVVAVAAFMGGFLRFDVWSGLGLGLILGIATFVLAVRRGRKRVEGAIKEVEGHVKSQRFDKAIEVLQSLKPVAKWQPRLGASLEGQIGMLKYAHMRDFEGARPHLQRSHPKMWQSWAMLAAAHFKKERWNEMRATFERAVKSNKGAPLLWATYAYCQWKHGGRDQAIAVLARGVAAVPKDDRLKTQLQALQNGKKLKMNQNDPEWLAMHLERTMPAPPPGAMRPRFLPPARKVGARYR